jgi:hypothetical protein
LGEFIEERRVHNLKGLRRKSWLEWSLLGEIFHGILAISRRRVHTCGRGCIY